MLEEILPEDAEKLRGKEWYHPEKMTDGIHGLFIFSEQSEGFGYWHNVYEKLEDYIWGSDFEARMKA